MITTSEHVADICAASPHLRVNRKPHLFRLFDQWWANSVQGFSVSGDTWKHAWERMKCVEKRRVR